ncbi:acyl-CoA thioesterase [Niallia sp. Krafla_26]|uniref:acyl-CoA thioesterase n=1 Tax=Niallia sp. Krafla_26 TaxID=3064703 RepID=UPI003D16D5D9
MENARYCKESLAVKTSLVLPPDTNSFGTMFGGKLMAYIDDIAAIAAMRHARKLVVTASSDSVDFISPIKEGQSVCLEAFVTSTGRTSMEVFVKVIGEDIPSGERKICAISFLTFVALDEKGHPTEVPKVIPESEEEIHLHETAKERLEIRKNRRKVSERQAKRIGAE